MNIRTLCCWTALLSAAAGVVLLAVRAYYAISLSEPLFTVTSGAEEESLYAFWRFIHGMPVYTDPHKLPFYGAIYNWAYYYIFGGITGGVLGLFGLADAWLPTVVRFIALSICILGTFVMYRLLIFAVPTSGAAMKTIAAAFSVFFFFGPLAGFWSISANMEFLTNLFMIASLFLFMKFYPERPLAAVMLFCVVAYLSWAVKQNYVYAPGAVGLFLLWRRDWKPLAMLVIVLPAAALATIVFGDEVYRGQLLFRNTSVALSFHDWFRNITNAGVKTLPVTIGLAAVLWAAVVSARLRNRIVAHPWFVLFLSGTVVSLLIVTILSSKFGAAENYYFPVVFFASALLFVSLAAVMEDKVAVRPVLAAFSGAWGLNLLAIIAVLAGFTGVLSTRDWHDKHAAIKQCMENLPRPAFTGLLYNLLPWMYPAEHHFILAYNYRRDRAAGRRFERGGIGGLIADGYFASLLLTVPDGRFDGTRIADGYQRTGRCAGVDVFRRRPAR